MDSPGRHDRGGSYPRRGRDQASVGGEILRGRKASDRTNLGLQQPRSERTDARDGLYSSRGLIAPHGGLDVAIEHLNLRGEQRVIRQHESDLSTDNCRQFHGGQPRLPALLYKSSSGHRRFSAVRYA
jgi:hypothetical protein